MIESYPSQLILLLFALCLINCKSLSQADKMNKTIPASSLEDCSSKNGYWYKEQCWLHFEEYDGGITKAEIDNEVARLMKVVEKYSIQLDGKSYPIKMFMPEVDEDGLILITIFSDKTGDKTLLCIIENMDENAKSVLSNTMLLKGDIADMEEEIDIESLTIAAGEIEGSLVDGSNGFEIKFDGSISGADNEIKVKLFVGESLVGMGNTTIEIRGQEAFINGTLGTVTYAQMKNLINDHPEIKTLVLEDVPGSMNDDVNMHTGRLVKENGINTVVNSYSVISSGGVDLFCAGNERIIHQGAKLGIHSWGGEGISAHELSVEHPAHQYQIDYFTMCLGSGLGPKFYFHTLTAAVADEMHWMSDPEIKEWELATTFIAK